MKRALFSTVVLFAALLSLSVGVMAEAVAEEAAPKTLSSRIGEVTVFSDRARVTRTATVGLRKAPVTFAIEKLPGWVDDGSVRVALSPPDAGRIVDVRVKRTHLGAHPRAPRQGRRAALCRDRLLRGRDTDER